MSRPILRARSTQRERLIDVLSPGVGLFTATAREGDLVRAGTTIGLLEVLGVRWDVAAASTGVVAAVGAAGAAAMERPPGRRPVDYGQVLVTLDREALRAGEAAGASEAGREQAGGDLVFVSPSSGRFYSRPAPDKPAFVAAGDELHEGKTVCLLEVMKTFNRIEFSGAGMPERVRVVSVEVEDGDDVAAGQPILKLAEIA
jgi:acetyl-CoA carboxylase biotin carboxyl carrier protein